MMQESFVLKNFAPDESLILAECFKKAILNPVHDLWNRPSKKLRNELVKIGYAVAQSEISSGVNLKDQRLSVAFDFIESLHCGSLIIDDIEDGSEERRGDLTLHKKYGLPIALNVGNWLYFWSTQFLQKLELSNDEKLKVYQLYHETMLFSHYGQSLDLSTKMTEMSKEQVSCISRASIELKTGSLTAFAVCLGAILGGIEDTHLEVLKTFGVEFGVALQMFDDLGNAEGELEPIKRFEDLLTHKPSWIWGTIALHYDEANFRSFVAAIQKLPEQTSILSWFEERNFFKIERQRATHFLSEKTNSLFTTLSQNKKKLDCASELILVLNQKLAQSYGKF